MQVLEGIGPIDNVFFQVMNECFPQGGCIQKNGKIYVAKEIFLEVESWKRQHIKVETMCRAMELSSIQISRVKKTLKERNKICNTGIAMILSGTYIELDDKDMLLAIIVSTHDRADYNSPDQLAKKFGLKIARIQKAVAAGRIEQTEKGILCEDFRALVEKDQKTVALNLVLDEVILEEGVILTRSNRQEIVERLSADVECVRGEFLLDNSAKRNELYFFNRAYAKEAVKKLLRRGEIKLSIDNYGFLWKTMPPQLSELIINFFNVTEGECNPSVQPILNNVMLAALQVGKDSTEWHEGDLTVLRRSACSQKTYDLICKMMQKGYERGLSKMKPGNIQKFRKKKHVVKQPDMYSEEQLFALFGLLFLEKDKCFEKVIEDSISAQIFLFVAMHLVSVWRRGDILRIQIFEEDMLMQKVSDLAEGVMDEQYFREVWQRFAFEWKNFQRANKQGGSLVLACPHMYEPTVGVYLGIAEFHRIKEGREKIFANESCLENVKNYFFAFGEETYKELFGKEPFRSRKANKRMLQFFSDKTRDKYKGRGLKTFAEIVPAYLRGHKVNIENGSQSITSYIDHSSDGLSLDEVSLILFEIGSFGFYKEFIVEKLIPRFRQLRLDEKATVLNVFDVDPKATEEALISLEKINFTIENFEKMPESWKDLLALQVGTAICEGQGTANEEHVFCLYSALTGRRNKECKKWSYCSGCETQNTFCKYGMFAHEYLYNLLLRERFLMEQNEMLIEKIGSGVDDLATQNTIVRNQTSLKKLREILLNFVQLEGYPEELKKCSIEERKRLHEK